jgi:protein SCO1/2
VALLQCRLACGAPVLAALALSACSAGREEPSYELKGQILAVRAETHEVLIKHGDIRGFMPGMTMPFKVRDERLLSGKAAGDLVTARLVVGREEAWLSALEKTGTAPLEEKAAFPAASFVEPVHAGSPAPDAALIDQTGQPLTISAWRDAAVVITFIYLRCPLPQFCPLMDRRFVEVQRITRAEATLAGHVRLLSVSFDALHDTPEAMAAHAATVGADPAIWRFATAAPETVDPFAAAFGVNVIREQDGTITHNLRTAVIAPGGRVVNVYDGGDWTAAQVIDDLRAALPTR